MEKGFNSLFLIGVLLGRREVACLKFFINILYEKKEKVNQNSGISTIMKKFKKVVAKLLTKWVYYNNCKNCLT